MHFLPHFPLHISSFTLFGLILLLGLAGGEFIGRYRFLPRILGYIVVGLLIGPNGFNWVSDYLLADTHLFVDISLGLILFELGRQLDFAWLYRDQGLLLMAIAESGFTFCLIFTALYLLGLPGLSAILIAIVAIPTSPAVVMMVAYDLSAHGPVTRRTLMLTSLNNLFALILFTLLLPFTQAHIAIDSALLSQTVYRLLGSMLFGLVIFVITMLIACLTGKRKESQFILFICAIVLAITFSSALNLSNMLTLFSFGAAARNLDRKHLLMEVDFGWLARLFFILLFVIIGIHLQFQGLWQATWAVLAFVFLRAIGKVAGVWLFAKKTRITKQQAVAISLALSPMAGVALGMSNKLIAFNPELGHLILTIIAAVVAILNIIGPILTQIAFVKTKEAAVT